VKHHLFNILTSLAPAKWVHEFAVKQSGIGHVGQTPEAWVEAYAIKKWNRPIDFDGLKFAFTDEHGRTWWEYPESLGLPMSRVEVSLQNASMLSVMITDAQLEELQADIEVALAKGNMIVAGAVLYRFFTMRDQVRCLDIMVNAIALTLVRSDEKPTTFDPVTHQDKINYLKDAIERGDGFFFRLTEVKKLSERFKLSEDHWSVWYRAFQEEMAARNREREAILSLLSSNG
jgi:hypothetical protein